MANDTDPFDKHQTIQSTNEAGKPVDSRIYDATAAWAIYDKLKTDFEHTAIERARIKGQQDGNPPFSVHQRKRLGLSWMANVNFRRAKSTVRLNSASVWNMFTSVPAFIDLSLKSKRYKSPEQPSEDWGAVIAGHFSDILLDWEDFYYNLRLRIDETLTFGIGPVFWPDEKTWKSETIKTANCLIPSKTLAKPSGTRHAAIRDEIDVTKLYAYIEDEESAKEMGWNVTETRKAIVRAYKHGQQDTNEEFLMTEWENAAHMILANDYDIDTQFDGVKIIHMLTQETKGKITHMIIQDEVAGNNKEKQFMFKKKDRFSKMSEVLQFLTVDVGDGYMKSVKGLAYDLYPTDDIGNRLTCQVLDGVTLSSGLMLQPQTGEDASKTAVMRKGPVTVIAPAYNAIQSSFAPPIDRSLSALQLVYSIQNNNSGVYQNNTESFVGQKTRTAEEVRTEAQNEARHENNQAEWYYVAWELWLKETLRRMLARKLEDGDDGYEEQEEFFRRCKEDEVPGALMDFNKWTIKAVKAIGLGSPVMAQNHTNFLLNLASSLDTRGRANAVRDAIMVRMGPDKVDRYAPLNSRDDIQTSAHSWAAMENNDFAEGQDVPAGEDDPHKIHVTMHLKKASEFIQAYAQGDPNFNIQAAMPFLMKAMPHTETHIQYMMQNPMTEGAGKSFMEAFQRFVEVFKRMAKDYQQLMAEQQKRQQNQSKLLEEAEQKKKEAENNVEMEKIRSKERVAMADAQSINNVRLAKLEASVQAAMQKAIAEIERENAKALAEIQRKQVELESKLRSQESK